MSRSRSKGAIPALDAPLHRKREARAWLPGPRRGAFADDPRIWNRVVSCGTLWLKARCRRGEPPALALQPFRREPTYDPARSSGPLHVVALGATYPLDRGSILPSLFVEGQQRLAFRASILRRARSSAEHPLRTSADAWRDLPACRTPGRERPGGGLPFG